MNELCHKPFSFLFFTWISPHYKSTVKRYDIDFVETFVTSADLTLTDHNIALNNGAFIMKNSAWSKKFISKWSMLTESKFAFPFSDNGSFIETILSYVKGYNKDCQVEGISDKEYLTCAVSYLVCSIHCMPHNIDIHNNNNKG
jgi:hypothetical protein